MPVVLCKCAGTTFDQHVDKCDKTCLYESEICTTHIDCAVGMGSNRLWLACWWLSGTCLHDCEIDTTHIVHCAVDMGSNRLWLACWWLSGTCLHDCDIDTTYIVGCAVDMGSNRLWLACWWLSGTCLHDCEIDTTHIVSCAAQGLTLSQHVDLFVWLWDIQHATYIVCCAVDVGRDRLWLACWWLSGTCLHDCEIDTTHTVHCAVDMGSNRLWLAC